MKATVSVVVSVKTEVGEILISGDESRRPDVAVHGSCFSLMFLRTR